MKDGNAEEITESVPPDEAFAVLGHETRTDILLTLWEAYDPNADDNGLSYSELYDRVEYDSASNFNYHLEQLTERFIVQTEEGYTLRWAGLYFVRSVVVAGMVTDAGGFGPSETGASCPVCDGPVVITYQNCIGKIECTRCRGIRSHNSGQNGFLFSFPLPPAGVANRTPDEVLHAGIIYLYYNLRLLRDDLCFYCTGSVDAMVDICEDHTLAEGSICPRCDRHHISNVSYVCSRCKGGMKAPGPLVGSLHPAVTTALQNRDPQFQLGPWDSIRKGLQSDDELIGTDPVRIRICVPTEDGQLEFVLDDALSITDMERDLAPSAD